MARKPANPALDSQQGPALDGSPPAAGALLLDVRQTVFLAAAVSEPQFASTRYGVSKTRLAPHRALAMQMLLELSDCGAIVLERDSQGPTWVSAYAAGALPTWRLSEPFSSMKDLRSQLLGVNVPAV